MYYYAYINPNTGVCLSIEEMLEPYDDPCYILIDEYDESLICRKKWVNGQWVDSTASEAQIYDAKIIGVNGEWLDEKIVAMCGDIEDHAHSEYALTSDLELLQDIIDTKADSTHTHSEYSTVSHTHNIYATVESLNALETEVNDKASSMHIHSDYALASDLNELENTVNTKADSSHTHSTYASVGHNHDEDYADINHNHDSVYSDINHDHDEDYASISHSHSDYATVTTLNTLEDIVDGKADVGHSHSNYALASDLNTLEDVVGTKANASHTHDDRYYTETEIDTKLSEKADYTHNHNSVYDTKGSATSALTSAKVYTDSKIDALVGDGASTTLDTIGEISSAIEDNQDAIDLLNSAIANKSNIAHSHAISDITNLQNSLDGKANSSHGTHVSYSTATPVMDGTANVGTASTVARSDHKHPTDTSRAAQASLDSHTGNKSNPHSVTLAQLGVTATAGELNYVDGVTSNIQTQINGKANSSHGTHVTYSTTVPVANGTASVGSETTVARSDHRHPLQTTVSGNAGTATKLATARTISLTGDVSGSTSFDGSGNVSITATVADGSHNHTIANIDGLQTAINGKSATNHTHTADALIQMAEALFGTNSLGGVEYSYGSNSGKNVLTEISNMPQGFHTIYAIGGTAGNPETAESYRYFIHKTSTTIGWIYAFGADGSIYSNYLAGANTYKGWKTIHDAKRKPLWTGSYYMTAGHTATPSKKLSQCEHGWMLLWSDYDPNTSTVNNTDFCTTMIPNRNWVGGTWNGAAYYCDVPRYTAGTATDSESRIIKVLNVYDNKLVGTENNNAAPRNDVILRAIYEF